MKQKRSLIYTVLLVVLAICISILFSGCASMGKGKQAESGTESPGQADSQSVAVKGASGSNPEASNDQAVKTAGSGAQLRVTQASSNSGEDNISPTAAYLLQALERVIPGTLPELNWNRIATVVVGLLIIGMIYGLALAIGRLPARRQRVASRGGGG